jgi:hypothetical protein
MFKVGDNSDREWVTDVPAFLPGDVQKEPDAADEVAVEVQHSMI